MRRIEKIISEIETCINQGTFKKLEDDKLDLKDNSHSTSEWREVFKTCCAFLNTGGGIVLIGVYEDERNKKFSLTGFDKRMRKRRRQLQEFSLTKKSNH